MIEIQGFEDNSLLQSKLILWLELLAKSHSFNIHQLSYSFVSDEEILRINNEHLNHDYITDIITFDYSSSGKIIGEIFISLPQVIRQSGDFNTSTQEEILRVMAHGLLHLMGFNDKTAAEQLEMRKEEDKALLLHAQISKN